MTSSPFTVLYDGGCPMCSREILHYQRIGKDLPIHWVDVTQPDVDLAAYGLDLGEALKLFHVVDSNGVMQVGARAFRTLWSELPGYRYLGRFCRMSGLAPVLEAIYVRFAGWHFKKRCRDGVCGLPHNPASS
jgi:predicted DCC family thiol-disulfide oxidoreductase YuxK